MLAADMYSACCSLLWSLLYLRYINVRSDVLQDATGHGDIAVARDPGVDQALSPTVPQPGNEDLAGDAQEKSSDAADEGEDLGRDEAAQAAKRRPGDPVLPNKRGAYVKEKLGVLKGRVGTACRTVTKMLYQMPCQALRGPSDRTLAHPVLFSA
jgi:hypothetical protein